MASMAQATGYCRAELREGIHLLQALHEEASAELSASPLPGSPDEWGRYGVLRHKFSQQRFLDVLKVPPFTPHSGGSLYSPMQLELSRSPLVKLSAGTSLA